MGLFSFKQTQKPRRFNHIPIYWNPEKEDLKELEEKHQKKDDGEYKIGIQRGSFRKLADRSHLDERYRKQRKLMYKLVFALILLILLAVYLIINGNAIFSLYFDNGF